MTPRWNGAVSAQDGGLPKTMRLAKKVFLRNEPKCFVCNTALERQLYRAMNQSERLQRTGNGEIVPRNDQERRNSAAFAHDGGLPKTMMTTQNVFLRNKAKCFQVFSDRRLAAKRQSDAARWTLLREGCADVVALRRRDQHAESLRIEQAKLLRFSVGFAMLWHG